MELQRAGLERPLPIIPKNLLRKYRVFEKYDNRFRACARLLQALWRERQGLPIGTYETPDGRQRRIGSLIGASVAEAGRNFLSPDIAHLARREMTYQEPGALIDQKRLYANLLSSMPLALNLFAPLKFDPRFAAKVIRSLIPGIDLARVLKVAFEHSPGRRQTDLTGDRTAFDVAITYERSDGEQGFLGIEVKYSESLNEPPPAELNVQYDALAPSSCLFKQPMSALLRVNPLQQLFREHLLAQAALSRGDWKEATFILIAPRHNHLAQQAARLYAAHLTEPGPGQAGFLNIELEQMIEALGWAGELDFAYALHDRYCNWLKLDGIIEEALRAKSEDWAIVPPRAAEPVALIGRAA